MPTIAPFSRPFLLRNTLLALAALLAWDAGGLDLPLARLFGDAAGFALRDHWLLGPVMHEGGRLLGWLGALLLCLGVWWPRGPLRGLARRHRLQLAVSTLAAALAVSVLKGFAAPAARRSWRCSAAVRSTSRTGAGQARPMVAAGTVFPPAMPRPASPSSAAGSPSGARACAFRRTAGCWRPWPPGCCWAWRSRRAARTS